MGGAVSTGRDNNELIDNLMGGGYIRTSQVERVFRAVDRANYMTEKTRDQAYKDLAWRVGSLHMSAPCIYSEVMEGLDLKPGLSFFNVGSGTGYLSTMVGLIIGSGGINHGIEVNPGVVYYAKGKLQQFMEKSPAMDEFEFCEPKFYCGNGLCLAPLQTAYDRLYVGAGCPEEYQNYFKQLIKVGGILVMPLNDNLIQVKRVSDKEWITRSLLNVSFASMIVPTKEDTVNMVKLDEQTPARLQVLARGAIRLALRGGVLACSPELKESPARAHAPLTKSKAPRRICIPVDDLYDSDNNENPLNNLHDLDRDNGANEMNGLLSLVLSMGHNRVAGALRFDSTSDSDNDEIEGEVNNDQEDNASESNASDHDNDVASENDDNDEAAEQIVEQLAEDIGNLQRYRYLRGRRIFRLGRLMEENRRSRSPPRNIETNGRESVSVERDIETLEHNASGDNNLVEEDTAVSEGEEGNEEHVLENLSNRFKENESKQNSNNLSDQNKATCSKAITEKPNIKSNTNMEWETNINKLPTNSHSITNDQENKEVLGAQTKLPNQRYVCSKDLNGEVEQKAVEISATSKLDADGADTSGNSRHSSEDEVTELRVGGREKRQKLDSGIGEENILSSGSSPAKTESKSESSDDDESHKSDNGGDEDESDGPRRCRRQKRGHCQLKESFSSCSDESDSEGSRRQKRRGNGDDTRRELLSVAMKRACQMLPLPHLLKMYVNFGRPYVNV